MITIAIRLNSCSFAKLLINFFDFTISVMSRHIIKLISVMKILRLAYGHDFVCGVLWIDYGDGVRLNPGIYTFLEPQNCPIDVGLKTEVFVLWAFHAGSDFRFYVIDECLLT